MNSIPAWDGSVEKWTEYETEVLWLEESLKPGERPQLVARLFKALSAPGKKAIQSESAKTFAGKDAEKYMQFLQRKVGILPIPDLGNKLGDFFFRLTRFTGETTAQWSISSDGVYQRLLSALERATGRKTKVIVRDSSGQTKPDERAGEFEIVDDFDHTQPFGTARSRPWSTQAKSLQSARTAASRRILGGFGLVGIPRLHLALIDPHDVHDGFLPTHVCGWLLHRISKLGPQERTAILSATCGDTRYS